MPATKSKTGGNTVKPARTAPLEVVRSLPMVSRWRRSGIPTPYRPFRQAPSTSRKRSAPAAQGAGRSAKTAKKNAGSTTITKPAAKIGPRSMKTGRAYAGSVASDSESESDFVYGVLRVETSDLCSYSEGDVWTTHDTPEQANKALRQFIAESDNEYELLVPKHMDSEVTFPLYNGSPTVGMDVGDDSDDNVWYNVDWGVKKLQRYETSMVGKSWILFDGNSKVVGTYVDKETAEWGKKCAERVNWKKRMKGGEKEVFTLEEYTRMQRVRTSGALDNVVRNR